MNSQQPRQTNNMHQWLAQAGPKLIFKLILLFIGVGTVTSLFSWLIFSEGFNFQPSLALEQTVLADEPTELLAQPGFVELAVNDKDLGVIQRFDPPQTIEIDGFQLTVSDQYLTDRDLWNPNDHNDNQVGWLENSIINYTFRLSTNRGHQEILAEAVANQETITLHTADGKQLMFKLSSENHHLVTNQQISQATPAITFIWLDKNEDIQTASGIYHPSIEQLPVINYPLQTLDTSLAMSGFDDVTVQLNTAELQTDGLQILTRGVITNKSPDIQIISAQDITLKSDNFVSQIIAANPPLPWQLPANNSQMIFSLTLQRLPVAQAQLTIGEQVYEINITE